MHKRLLWIICLLVTGVCVHAQPWPSLTEGAKALGTLRAEAKLLRNKLPLIKNVSVTHPATPVAVLSAHETHVNALKLLSHASLETSPIRQRPQIPTLEPQLHHFIFTISPRNQPQQVMGTGFVFAQTENEKAVRLWGATSAQVAQQAGKDILVTFHAKHQPDVSFPGEIVVQGHPDGSNAALIRLPQQITTVAMPIPLQTPHIHPRWMDDFMVYGFNTSGNVYKAGLSHAVYGPERMLAIPESFLPDASVPGGLVVNDSGHAVGILTRSYSLEKVPTMGTLNEKQSAVLRSSPVAEFTPIRHLDFLLREYEETHAGERVIIFNGQNIGKIALNEAIEKIIVLYFYPPQSAKILQPNPFWSLYNLDQFIPDLEHATQIFIYIDAGEQGNYYYVIDRIEKSVEKTPTLKSDYTTAANAK